VYVIPYNEVMQACMESNANKYVYDSQTEDSYIKTKKKQIDVKCATHGLFHVSITLHLQGRGCPDCANAILNNEHVQHLANIDKDKSKYEHPLYANYYAEKDTENMYNSKTKRRLLGSTHPLGYIHFTLVFNDKKIPIDLHRFKWECMHGRVIPDQHQIDHIDGNRLNNNIDNLRIVSNQQNQWNHTKAKGYSRDKVKQKWRSHINVNSKKIHLGYYTEEEEARQAYLDAKLKFHIIN